MSFVAFYDRQLKEFCLLSFQVVALYPVRHVTVRKNNVKC